MKLLTGEWPGRFELGPGEELDISPAGLGTCKGFRGELATRLEPGLGCGSIGMGDGLMFGGSEGGDAKLKEVAGLEPKLVCVFV